MIASIHNTGPFQFLLILSFIGIPWFLGCIFLIKKIFEKPPRQ